MTLSFKRIRPAAQLPRYAHASDAGMDVQSAESLVIPAKARALVPTGLVANIPPGYEIQVRPRSGLAFKKGVTVLNAPGTIDAGYRGEIGVLLVNLGDEPFEITAGDRIAQLVVAPVLQPEIVEASDVDETDRGVAGFGSTGV